MSLINKRVIYSLKNEIAQRHIGEYFQVIKFNKKYFLFYGSENKLKVVVSNDLFFNSNPKIIMECPGGVFCVIREGDILFMLCGCHVSNNEPKEIRHPNFVWPDKATFLLNSNNRRTDRKNGMYLFKSIDGFDWEELTDKPVLHSFVSSETVKLGEIAFDTSPFLIKLKSEYLYYGRLNSSLDERRVYMRRSHNLTDWSAPIKINIINENSNNLKKNYYNFVVFFHNNNLYAFTPYFEACGTEKRECQNGKTLLLKSDDGINWEIINEFKKHNGKYRDRVNDVLIENGKILVFYRENVLDDHQNLVCYDFNFN